MMIIIGMKILILKIEAIVLAFGLAMYDYMKHKGNNPPY
jgi:hypothetical protein